MKTLTYGQLGKALIRLLLRPRRRYQLDMFKDIRPEMFLDAGGETYVGHERGAIREYVLAHFPQALIEYKPLTKVSLRIANLTAIIAIKWNVLCRPSKAVDKPPS